MKNKEYWRISLEEVLDFELSEEFIENIMSISEMEYEYEYTEVTYDSTITIVDKKLKQLEQENNLLKDFIAKQNKVDSVSIDNGSIKFYTK